MARKIMNSKNSRVKSKEKSTDMKNTEKNTEILYIYIYIYTYIYIYLITLCNTDKVGRKKYQFQIFVADMGQKRTSFKTVSHNHLLTIKVSKSIFFGSNMGQTKQKLFEWDFPGFSVRSCDLHLEHIFLQNNSKEFWAPSSSPAANYVQRWALCSNHLANVSVSVKHMEVVVSS